MQTIKCESLSFEWLLGRYSPLGISSFEESSIIKIVVFRGFGTTVDPWKDFVGQHMGKVVDLLENSEYNVRCLDHDEDGRFN